MTAAGIGGTTVLAGAPAGSLGLAGIAPVLGGLGLVGVAGMTVMSVRDCRRPMMCVATNNQCCVILITIRGRICPTSC